MPQYKFPQQRNFYMSDLTKVNGAELAELNQILGTEVAGGASNTAIVRVPELKINAKSKNKVTKKSIPEGYFYLRGTDQVAYAETVTFRPLASHIQYFHWDGEGKERKLKNKSLAVKSVYKDEARDMLGSIACGMPNWEARKEMNKEEAKYWRDMQHRVTRGLVSYEGETEDGEKVVVENQPCIMFHKNSTYSGFYNEVIKKLPNGSQLYNYEIKLTSSYNENGSVIWYTYNYEPNLKKELPLSEDVKATMRVFADTLRAENKYIDQKYFEAIKEGSIDSKATEALKSLGDNLDDDFEAA